MTSPGKYGQFPCTGSFRRVGLYVVTGCCHCRPCRICSYRARHGRTRSSSLKCPPSPARAGRWPSALHLASAACRVSRLQAGARYVDRGESNPCPMLSVADRAAYSRGRNLSARVAASTVSAPRCLVVSPVVGVVAHRVGELSPVAPECHHRVTGTGVVPPCSPSGYALVCLVAAGPGMRNPTRRAENGRV